MMIIFSFALNGLFKGLNFKFLEMKKTLSYLNLNFLIILNARDCLTKTKIEGYITFFFVIK